jgi:hypothetical protein
MTTLYVDNIAPNLQSKISAPDIQLPSGSVVQVISEQFNPTSTSSTTSTSYVASAFSSSITPTSASNKILVMIDLGLVYTSGTSHGAIFAIARGATLLNTGASPTQYGHFGETNGGNMYFPLFMHHLDSPNTISEVTYTVYMRNQNGSETGIHEYAPHTFTFMEIAG